MEVALVLLQYVINVAFSAQLKTKNSESNHDIVGKNTYIINKINSCALLEPLPKRVYMWFLGVKIHQALQGDNSTCSKPPVDFKTKVLLWPGQARPAQAKMELLF